MHHTHLHAWHTHEFMTHTWIDCASHEFMRAGMCQCIYKYVLTNRHHAKSRIVARKTKDCGTQVNVLRHVFQYGRRVSRRVHALPGNTQMNLPVCVLYIHMHLSIYASSYQGKGTERWGRRRATHSRWRRGETSWRRWWPRTHALQCI